MNRPLLSALCVATAFVVSLLAPRAGVAATSETCTVTGVLWQKPLSGAPDIMSVSCSDSTGYSAYVGTPGQNPDCYASIDTVKAWETLATSALLSGRHLIIWYTTLACPNNGSARVPQSITAQ
jgi:hypothetical protein